MTSIQPSSRLDKISPSAMRELFEIANRMRAEGKTVIDFGLGDINIPLPEAVLSAIKQAVDEGKTKYGPNQGQPILRQKLAEVNNKDHDLQLDQDNVLITCGSLESLYNIAMAYINPGDEVLFAEPEFPYFGYQVRLAGGELVPLSVNNQTDFMLTPEMVNEAITPKTKALLINYPNNPTAAILEKKNFDGIVEVCEDANIMLISDEAYERITFDGFRHQSGLDYDYENILVVNSASKALCMTGLRVGYTITNNKELLKPVMQVHQYNTAHAAVNNQYGVLAGLEHFDDIISNSVSILQERRDAMVKYWSDIPGIEFDVPKGTFYLYPNVEASGMSAAEFTKFSLEQGIVLTPGGSFCFDSSNPGGYDHFRASYGMASVDDIAAAAETLKIAFEKR